MRDTGKSRLRDVTGNIVKSHHVSKNPRSATAKLKVSYPEGNELSNMRFFGVPITMQTKSSSPLCNVTVALSTDKGLHKFNQIHSIAK